MDDEKQNVKKPINKNKLITIILIVVFSLLLLLTIIGSWAVISHKKEVNSLEWTEASTFIKSNRQRKKIIRHQKVVPLNVRYNKTGERDQQDLNGYREKKVKVDVGFDSTRDTLPTGESYNGTDITRDYWGYTNSHEQLVFVNADKIILQNDKLEAPWEEGSGRYSSSVSSVKGCDDTYDNGIVFGSYDKGHVIADSLGGMSIAYNVTPQDSYINGSTTYPGIHGMQAQFEDEIRNYGGAEYFTARIEYANKKTNIPSKYHVSYIIGNEYKEYTFSNQRELWWPS